jgi:hypothetical protein
MIFVLVDWLKLFRSQEDSPNGRVDKKRPFDAGFSTRLIVEKRFFRDSDRDRAEDLCLTGKTALRR